MVKMDAKIRYIKKVLSRIALFPLRLLPIKDSRVLLINDLSYNYSGNMKVIDQWLEKNDNAIGEILFAVKNPRECEQLHPNLNKTKFVKFNSLSYFVSAMTSRVCVTNSGGLSYIPLRPSRFVINTWHGGGAYKQLGIHCYEDTPVFRKDLKLSAEQYDLFLSTNRKFTRALSEAFCIPEEVFWEIGMPRNDLLVDYNSEEAQQRRTVVREELGLSDEDKLVLFAPTYRKVDDNYFKESISIPYGIDPARVCNALKKRFGGNWIFGYRMHPCIVNQDGFYAEESINLSDYEDMQDLLLAADVMVNDFSSSMWDFMLTGKPSFLFAVDLDHYIESTKVYTPVSEWPFPSARDNSTLEYNILTFSEEDYKADLQSHYDALGGCETGCATEKVGKKISEICNQ